MASGGLTNKQKLFVKQYLVDLNATQAAIRAGYSKKRASEIAYQLLQKTTVQEAIQKAMDKRSNRLDITADNVLKELAKIGFSDMRKFSKWGPEGIDLKKSGELSDEDAACIAEVSQSITGAGGSIKFKLHDKKGALELLGKHLGIFTDKTEITGKDGGPIENNHTVKIIRKQDGN